jgi:hypothetical protein
VHLHAVGGTARTGGGVDGRVPRRRTS